MTRPHTALQKNERGGRFPPSPFPSCFVPVERPAREAVHPVPLFFTNRFGGFEKSAPRTSGEILRWQGKARPWVSRGYPVGDSILTMGETPHPPRLEDHSRTVRGNRWKQRLALSPSRHGAPCTSVTCRPALANQTNARETGKSGLGKGQWRTVQRVTRCRDILRPARKGQTLFSLPAKVRGAPGMPILPPSAWFETLGKGHQEKSAVVYPTGQSNQTVGHVGKGGANPGNHDARREERETGSKNPATPFPAGASVKPRPCPVLGGG
jgi:hypothetical protein